MVAGVPGAIIRNKKDDHHGNSLNRVVTLADFIIRMEMAETTTRAYNGRPRIAFNFQLVMTTRDSAATSKDVLQWSILYDID